MTLKRATKKPVKKFVYSCSVYIRDLEDLESLKQAAELSRDSLSQFLMKASLREAKRIIKSETDLA